MKQRRPSMTAVNDRLDKLTPREREILGLMALGLSNGEIATSLFLTVHAVKYHVSRIFNKLGVTNRTEAAIVYMRALGDVPEPE